MIKRTLYFGNPSILSLRNKQLLLRFPELEKNEEVKKMVENKGELTFPIEDLGFIILDHWQITITQALLESLVDNNVAVITCDKTHHPTGLLLPLESNTIQTERYREQLDATEPLKKQLWAQVVQQKIENQAAALKTRHPNNDVDYLIKLSQTVKSGDSDNREAVAASVYWSKLFPNIPQFVRTREGSSPNNLLNYGYAILRATVARSIVATGLLPTLGLHHRNRYNPYCLADDLMEPYRPMVDLLVCTILDKFGVPEELSKEIKTELLSVPALDVNMGNETSPLMIATQKTCQSLQKCFEGTQRKLLLPTLI
jgi:CRISPR-associated protein Cas1